MTSRASTHDQLQLTAAANPGSWSVFPAALRSGATENVTGPAIYSTLLADFARHKRLLSNASIDAAKAYPLLYIRALNQNAPRQINSSSSNWSVLSQQHYDVAQRQLEALKDDLDDDGEPVVEEAALDTAISLLDRFQRADYAPPLISWHGGEAVVMLWTVGNDTLAITATEGKIGYIIRRNLKQIARQDDIEPEEYRLEDLR